MLVYFLEQGMSVRNFGANQKQVINNVATRLLVSICDQEYETEDPNNLQNDL